MFDLAYFYAFSLNNSIIPDELLDLILWNRLFVLEEMDFHSEQCLYVLINRISDKNNPWSITAVINTVTILFI